MTEEEKEHQKRKAALVQDYLEVFDSEAGARVVEDILKQGRVLSSVSRDARTDRDYFLNEGRREMALYILDNISFNVDDIKNLLDTKDKKSTRSANDGKDDGDLFDFFD